MPRAVRAVCSGLAMVPTLVVLGVALLPWTLTGCAQPERPVVVTRLEAMDDIRPRRVHVVKVFDQVYDATDAPRDESVGYEVQVRILDGPEQGRLMLWPFDDWNVGHLPPHPGTDLVVAPADWVRRNPASQGRPYGGWTH